MVGFEEKPIQHIPNILFVRGSVFFFVLKLILVVIMASVLRFFVRIPILYFEFDRPIMDSLYNINSVVAVLSILFEVGLVIYVVLSWVSEYYEVVPGKITHRAGVFFRREQVHTTEHIQNIDLQQDVGGRLFNYGTIILYSPALEEKIVLYTINNPLRQMRRIQDILRLHKNNNNSKGKNIYLRTSSES